jgi:hypothetical protein
LAPFGQGGSTVMFENIAVVEVAFVIKEVVDRGIDGGEFLEGADVSWSRKIGQSLKVYSTV